MRAFGKCEDRGWKIEDGENPVAILYLPSSILASALTATAVCGIEDRYRERPITADVCLDGPADFSPLLGCFPCLIVQSPGPSRPKMVIARIPLIPEK
jgi:hypothetical protein